MNAVLCPRDGRVAFDADDDGAETVATVTYTTTTRTARCEVLQGSACEVEKEYTVRRFFAAVRISREWGPCASRGASGGLDDGGGRPTLRLGWRRAGWFGDAARRGGRRKAAVVAHDGMPGIDGKDLLCSRAGGEVVAPSVRVPGGDGGVPRDGEALPEGDTDTRCELGACARVPVVRCAGTSEVEWTLGVPALGLEEGPRTVTVNASAGYADRWNPTGDGCAPPE
ncbi:MAG: hypothetical protein R3A78_01090 [Polyangiales bacterium]